MAASKRQIKIWLSLIDRFNQWTGQTISWLTLVMVVTTFLVVLLRYVFQLGWVWLQEIVVYCHALTFLLAAGYTLLRGAHVRVDVFYRSTSPRRKAWINLVGTFLLLFPTCFLILWQAAPYVADSWRVFEGSKDGGGLEAVFVLKTAILIYAGLLLLQGVSLIGNSWLELSDE